MFSSSLHVRPFVSTDLEAVIGILRINGQLNFPTVDGPKPLIRVNQTPGTFFLVAEANNRIVGVTRGVWDGSRALVHQLSVHPHYQRKGIGTTLMRIIARKFSLEGAPSLSVTATEATRPFYERLGFSPVDVIFMVAPNIHTVTGEENSDD